MGRASKDKRDIYYRYAKEVGYRARSAFKLLQIHRAFGILDGVRNVVDLCAAPGGWTEVLSQQLAEQQVAAAAAASSAPSNSPPAPPVRIVAVDLQAMAPLPGVHFIQGDLTRAVTATLILDALGREGDDRPDERSTATTPMDSDATGGAAGSVSDVAGSAATPAPSTSLPLVDDGAIRLGSQRLAELVVCDGAPDVVGMHDVDECVQHELTLSALNIALHILRPCEPIDEEVASTSTTAAAPAAATPVATGAGAVPVALPASLPRPLVGRFVAKLFRGRRVSEMYALFQKYFYRVSISKPKSCRTSSVEGFVVCEGFRGLRAVGEEGRSMEDAPLQLCEAEGLPLRPVPFVSCWDDERLDSDMSYPLSYTFRTLRDAHGSSGAAGATTSDGASSNAATSTAPSSASVSGYQNLAPSAMPIDPPYMRSLQMKKLQNKAQ